MSTIEVKSRRELEGRGDTTAPNTADPSEIVASGATELVTYEQAFAEWRNVNARVAALARGNVLTIDDLGGRRERDVFDDVEAVAMRAALRREQERAAMVLDAVRARSAAEKRERANTELPAAVEVWTAASTATQAALDVVATKLAALVASVWTADELRAVENARAQESRRIAVRGVGDDEDLKRQIKLNADTDVPTRVGETFVETIDRPDRGLFGDGLADTRSMAFWTRLLEVLTLPRARGMAQLKSGSRVERRLAEIIENGGS